MDRQLTPNEAPDTGFSLVELLVVVAILSVLAVGVTMAAIRPDSAETNTDRASFEARYATQYRLAVMGRQGRGLSVTPRGLVAYRRTPDGWQALPSRHRWDGRAALRVTARGPRSVDTPDIVFSSSGTTSAFDITFTSSGARPQRCTGDLRGGLECTP